MKTIVFSNGDEMPVLGLGTWKSKPGEVYQAVLWAIASGYRHIDCAAIYDNETEVGNALTKAFQDGIVKREEMFVTSKLWNNSHRREDVKKAIQKSLNDLGLEYLDLYLIHWPVSFKAGVGYAKTREEFYTYSDVPLPQTWSGMEEVKRLGLTRHIGVSNFNTAKLREIIKSGSVGPEMNQVEMHPFLLQLKLVDFCRSNGIQMTAYSPLGSMDRSSSIKKADEPSLLNHELIIELAHKHGATPAQILIAFSISRGMAVVPKSVNQERISENFHALKIQLDKGDMDQLMNIGKRYRFIDGAFFTGSQSPYKLQDLWENDG